MSHRPLAIVSGLTIGDYLLWNWSLNGSHDVLALVSGLTLPPLAAAFVWLIALTCARVLARTGRGSDARKSARTARNAGATKPSRAAFGRRRGDRRAAWLGELRTAKRTLTAERAQTALNASRAPSREAQTPPAAPSEAPQRSPSKRSRSSRKIAA